MAENKSENIDDFDKMLSDILEGESLKSDNEQMVNPSHKNQR